MRQLRVIVSCLQSLKRHDIPAYGFWRDYFINGLREADIEPLEVPGVDWAEGLTYKENSEEIAAWLGRTWEKTVDFARNEQANGSVTFFLGYLYPQMVDIVAVRELQRLGIPCVNFFCDNFREFRAVPITYHPFDLHWVPEYEALPLYNRANLPFINAPMPCWIPERMRDLSVGDSELPTFIGSADTLRQILIGQAIAEGADLVVRGPGWQHESCGRTQQRMPTDVNHRLRNNILFFKKHGFRALAAKLLDFALPPACPSIPLSRVRPSVWGDDYFRLTKQATVTVGINRVPVSRRSLRFPVSYSRLRDIEAPMLGACYLTEHTVGISRLYDLGKEIETYSSSAELAEKLKYLLANASLRRNLRVAGQRRALSDHSVAATLKKVLHRLGLG